jgi:hypothetical protein
MDFMFVFWKQRSCLHASLLSSVAASVSELLLAVRVPVASAGMLTLLQTVLDTKSCPVLRKSHCIIDCQAFWFGFDDSWRASPQEPVILWRLLS